MPVADTELLFALNPRDKKHEKALKALNVKNLKIPDTALLEFQIVLKSRGRSSEEVYLALEAVKSIFASRKIKEVKTISTEMLLLQTRIEERYKLSYFDSLIAASALITNNEIISDDEAFDRIPEVKRIALSSF